MRIKGGIRAKQWQVAIIFENLVIVNKLTVKQVKIINKNAMRFPSSPNFGSKLTAQKIPKNVNVRKYFVTRFVE